MLNWFGSHRPSGGKDKYTLKTLQDLYKSLARHQTVTAGNQAILIETIRSIAEVIVYGDQHTEQLFDYFCEKNMFPSLLGLLDQPNCGVLLKIQIIQSVSILVQNIRSEISLYYTLSNNHVNRLIAHPFSFSNEEVVGHYISFLKTLSLKLNHKTIQFFFNDRLNTFPLYQESIKFFDHGEEMVRTAVRSITLNVFRVDDQMMSDWLMQGPCQQYIEQVVRLVHRRCRRLHLLLMSAAGGGGVKDRKRAAGSDPSDQRAQAVAAEKQLSAILLRIEVALTEQQDHMLYLEDVLGLHVPGLEDVVVESTMAFLVLPLLVASLLPQTLPFAEMDDLTDRDFNDAGMEEGRKSAVLADESRTGNTGSLLSLFLIAHSFFWFSNPRMLNRLVESMLLPVGLDDELAGPPLMHLDEKEEGQKPPHTMEESRDADAKITHEHNGSDAANEKDVDNDDDDDETDDTDGASSLLAGDVIVRRSSLSSRSTPGSPGMSSEHGSRANPVRQAFLGFLRHPDERHCLAAACAMYALVNNSNVDQDLLKQTGLAPCRIYASLPVPPSAPLEEQDASRTCGDESDLDDQEDDDDKCCATDPGSAEQSTAQTQDLCQDPQGRYPNAVVTALLELLARDPPVSTLTQRVAAKLILDLSFFEPSSSCEEGPSEVHKVGSSTKPKIAVPPSNEPCLKQAHLEQLDKAYQSALLRVEAQIESTLHADKPARLVEMFELEWQSLCEGPLSVESLMTLPRILLPPSVTSDRHGSSEEMRRLLPLDSRLPASPLENTRCAIRGFMILRLLLSSIHRRNASSLAAIDLGPGSHVEGEGIDLRESDFIKVNVMEGTGAAATLQPAFLVLTGVSMVLVEPDKFAVGMGVVRSVAPLHRVTFAQGHSDELLMHVAVRCKQVIGWAHKQLQPLIAKSTSLSPTSDILAAALTSHSRHNSASLISSATSASDVAASTTVTSRGSHSSPSANDTSATSEAGSQSGANSTAGHSSLNDASSGNSFSESGGMRAQHPWIWAQDQHFSPSSDKTDLLPVNVWNIAMRFDDHASAYWARDQLKKAIDAAVQSKLRRIVRVVSNRRTLAHSPHIVASFSSSFNT